MTHPLRMTHAVYDPPHVFTINGVLICPGDEHPSHLYPASRIDLTLTGVTYPVSGDHDTPDQVIYEWEIFPLYLNAPSLQGTADDPYHYQMKELVDGSNNDLHPIHGAIAMPFANVGALAFYNDSTLDGWVLPASMSWGVWLNKEGHITSPADAEIGTPRFYMIDLDMWLAEAAYTNRASILVPTAENIEQEIDEDGDRRVNYIAESNWFAHILSAIVHYPRNEGNVILRLIAGDVACVLPHPLYVANTARNAGTRINDRHPDWLDTLNPGMIYASEIMDADTYETANDKGIEKGMHILRAIPSIATIAIQEVLDDVPLPTALHRGRKAKVSSVMSATASELINNPENIIGLHERTSGILDPDARTFMENAISDAMQMVKDKMENAEEPSNDDLSSIFGDDE